MKFSIGSKAQGHMYRKLFWSLAISFASALLMYLLIRFRLVEKFAGTWFDAQGALFILVVPAIISLLAFYKAITAMLTCRERRLSLRKKIFIALSGVSSLPLLLVGAFAVFFLHSSLQAWFDERIASVVEKSIVVSRVYMDESKARLARVAEQLVSQIESEHFNLMQQGSSISALLNKGLESGLYDAATVFCTKPDLVIARAGLPLSSIERIPLTVLGQSSSGVASEPYCEGDKMQTVVKFSRQDNTYLFLKGTLDKQIVEYLDKSYGAVASYRVLRDTVNALQLRFAFATLLLVLSLLAIAIYTVFALARMITEPILNLVEAVEVIQDGNLDARVPVASAGDEIATLGNAFNEMLLRISRQRRDLLAAQESLAWAQVARRVAHEINNPLTPIALSAEILESRFSAQVKDGVELKKYTRNILRYVDDIKNIVSSFSLFAKLPSPSFRRCALVPWLKQVVEGRQVMRTDKAKYSMASSIPEDLEMEFDVNQMGQVMSNLFRNSEEAFESAKTSDPLVSVHLSQENGQVLILVRDNGPGFVAEVLKEGGMGCISTKSGGSGLGLAMVRRIVEQHYGNLTLRNMQGGGSSVEIRIPLRQRECLPAESSVT